jgi:alpha-N-arabinofuranosidase
VTFTPQNSDECAGLVLLQNNNFHFRFVVTQADEPIIRLIKRDKGEEAIVAQQSIQPGAFFLKVEAHEQAYSFYMAMEPDRWELVAGNVDGRILSTPVAGGFVGAWIGLYASSNGRDSSNYASFDWFDYEELEIRD